MQGLASLFLAPSLAASNTGFGLVILVLCVAAGIGTVLLLPGRREASIRKIGGVIVLAAGMVGVALIVRVSASYSSGDIYFWIFSIIAIAASIRVISHPKPVYSALYFVLAVLASAGLFVLLWAEFMAAALVLIYAGAILVTYVFVIMLASQAVTGKTGGDESEAGTAEYDTLSREPVAAAAVGFALMGILLFVIFDKGNAHATMTLGPGTPSQIYGTVEDLGQFLFTDQVVNLELGGLILTLAMVGAIVIARRQVPSEVPVMDEEIDAKASPISDDPHSIPVYGTLNPKAKAYPEH